MNNITKSKTMLFKTPSTEHDMILYVLFSDYHLSDRNLKNLYNNYWSTELLPISKTQLFTKKLFIINSITTKWSLYLYTLFNYVTANINSKSTSKNTQNTINQYPLWLSYLCWMKIMAKTIWYLYFLGVEPTHTKKFTIIVIHVRKITLCTVVKRLSPYLEF